MNDSDSLPSSFPNSVWERTCPRNSVAEAGVSADGPRAIARRPPLHEKQSFARNRVPKRSLGTRTIGVPAHHFIPIHVHP